MKWTTERPTKPGVYWLRGANNEVCAVEVRERNGVLYAAWPNLDGWLRVAWCGRECHWAGPLLPPDEPAAQ